MITYKQKPWIILVSHGPLCEALVQSTQMVYGPMKNVKALPLVEGTDPDDYQATLNELIDECNGEAIFLIDILGGTPFNSVVKIARQRPLCAVTGMSMPMLLETLEQREIAKTGEELAQNVAQNTAQTVVDITPKLASFLVQTK